MSCETIYQAIYVHAHGELRRDLAGSLRRGRSRRKPHRDPQTRTSRFIDEMTPISQRPADVEGRTIPGHWEGDLIVGAGSGSAVATLVEGTTRYVVLGHLPIERTADAVHNSVITALQGMPASPKKTLTWDQGAEMSEHRAFCLATDMRSTSASGPHHGSAARTRTPTGCSGSIFPKAQTCAFTMPGHSPRSPTN